MESLYWTRLDELVSKSKITIDRPQGSSHPLYPDFIYPVNYGFLQDTLGSDGSPADIFLGSLGNKIVTGVLNTVDLKKNDIETKILYECSELEIQKIISVMNNHLMSAIFISRPPKMSSLIATLQ